MRDGSTRPPVRFEILDLTRRMDEGLEIYSEGDYSDPPLKVDPWCEIAAQGYRVSRLSMGTQTGTHIDAPAHFDPAGETLEALPADSLVGGYLWVDLARPAGEDIQWVDEPILFLVHPEGREAGLAEEDFERLLALPPRVWVMAFPVRIHGGHPFAFNRGLAQAGKYLVEDLDPRTALRVRPGGEMFALPLNLVGVSGSPCRLLVRQRV